MWRCGRRSAERGDTRPTTFLWLRSAACPLAVATDRDNMQAVPSLVSAGAPQAGTFAQSRCIRHKGRPTGKAAPRRCRRAALTQLFNEPCYPMVDGQAIDRTGGKVASLHPEEAIGRLCRVDHNRDGARGQFCSPPGRRRSPGAAPSPPRRLPPNPPINWRMSMSIFLPLRASNFSFCSGVRTLRIFSSTCF